MPPTSVTPPTASPDAPPRKATRSPTSSYEHASALSIVQMGARPYSPLLGRFLSVDPADGGSDYDYVHADPINETDLTGQCVLRGLRSMLRCFGGIGKGFVNDMKRAGFG